jgi:hypothetical protein
MNRIIIVLVTGIGVAVSPGQAALPPESPLGITRPRCFYGRGDRARYCSRCRHGLCVWRGTSRSFRQRPLCRLRRKPSQHQKRGVGENETWQLVFSR